VSGTSLGEHYLDHARRAFEARAANPAARPSILVAHWPQTPDTLGWMAREIDVRIAALEKLGAKVDLAALRAEGAGLKSRLDAFLTEIRKTGEIDLERYSRLGEDFTGFMGADSGLPNHLRERLVGEDFRGMVRSRYPYFIDHQNPRMISVRDNNDMSPFPIADTYLARVAGPVHEAESSPALRQLHDYFHAKYQLGPWIHDRSYRNMIDRLLSGKIPFSEYESFVRGRMDFYSSFRSFADQIPPGLERNLQESIWFFYFHEMGFPMERAWFAKFVQKPEYFENWVDYIVSVHKNEFGQTITEEQAKGALRRFFNFLGPG
jgi:hypothetical protein